MKFMTLALSERRSRVSQSEIRNMTIECERAGGINLAQGLCDTEVPVDVRNGAHDAIEAGIAIVLVSGGSGFMLSAGRQKG